MGKLLSLDLRSRLVVAVSEGISHRGAAERFGVSAASAVRWVEAFNTTGCVQAKPQGGDTRSHCIEAFSAVILAAVAAQKDISMAEPSESLRAHQGTSFGPAPSGAASTATVSPSKNSARSRAGAARRCGPAPGLVRSPA